VLLLLLPATAALGYARLQRLPGRRGPIALAMRLAVLTLLVGALAGPQWRLLERRVSVVFLVDASASMRAAGQRSGMEWAARAVPAAGPLDHAGLVLFGAGPRLAVPLAHYKTLPDPVGDPASATNIGAALGLGLAMLPPGVAGRLVLLSDGQDTTNDESGLTSAEALALARGVPIDVVPIAPPRLRDVAVRAVDVPRAARIGDHVPVRITLHSTSATKATLTLWIDGQAAQQAITLPAGDTVLRTDQIFSAAGLHTFRLHIEASGDAVPQNNTLEGATVVAPPGRVLLAVSNPAAATALATTLARAHLTVIPILATSLPASAAAYRGYDDVVLDDVPASVLSRAQQTALRDAVYNDGLGLVVVGGANSFGEGGYAHTPLEDALPVYSVSTPRRVTQPLALILVIDKSGSMADDVDGVAKINMVKVAASSALDKLADGDAVGVLAFDDTNHWIVPFHILQGAADKANIRRQISGLSADGDTYIYPALHAAERAVLTVPTIYRHIVLLTDGQGEDAGFDRLIRRMRREHITLSTIGVGQDVVQDELRHWAKLGGGTFHYVSDPHDIPRIIVNEARYGTAGSSEVRGHIKLGVGAASPLLSALAGDDLSHLSIDAYSSTLPKATAQVAMQSGSGDPILSSWQYGLGRTVAWTSDAGTKWARRWSPNRLPEFWVDLVRWSMRGYNPGSRVPTLQVHDGGLQIAAALLGAGGTFDDTASPRVRLVRPNGTAQLVPLVLSGPGLYTASVPRSGPGIYTARFVRNDVGTPAPADVTALAVPYPAEYADEGVNTAFLTHLAATTGGRVLTRPADTFAHAGLPSTVTWLPLWPLLLALALLLFPIEVGLRLLLPPEPMYRQRM
jgi:Mg-chelatase subunit ChlD